MKDCRKAERGDVANGRTEKLARLLTWRGKGKKRGVGSGQKLHDNTRTKSKIGGEKGGNEKKRDDKGDKRGFFFSEARKKGFFVRAGKDGGADVDSKGNVHLGQVRNRSETG